MKKYFFRLFLIFSFQVFIFHHIFAQKTSTIKGKVLDEKTKKPIVGANVFLANTSIGTASDSEGIFVIKNIAQKSLDLVVSSVGYHTIMIPIKMDILGAKSLTIILQEKIIEMKEITITASRGEAWYKNFEIFKNNFLGTDEFAKQCTIKNKGELYFNFQNNLFQAWADEALIIENPALGYVLKYQLKDFVLDFKQGYFVMVGYPFFEEMKGTPKQIKKWKKNRNEAYKGSIMHLIRSLYYQNWEKEGFTCKRLIRHPNKQRPSDSLIERKIKQFSPKNKNFQNNVITQGKGNVKIMANANGLTNITPNPQQDSLNYWIEKRKLPKNVQYLENKNLTQLDSIIVVAPQDTSLRKINLKSCLQITYKPICCPEIPAKSTILTFNKPNVLLQQDGYVIENLDITYEGYVTEKKIANMLPLDFFVSDL